MKNLQPIRGKKAREERKYDRTQLREKQYGTQVHRDYAAHFFRWGFVKRFINPTSTILDVGCGQDKPLYHILRASLSSVPKLYVGVDLNKLPIVGQTQWTNWHDQFDFIKQHQELIKFYGQFNVVICLEVIEHMNLKNGLKLLQGLRACCQKKGILLLSTPVFNGKAARNHIYEWTIPKLQKAFIDTGFVIINRFGTFASYHDLKLVLTTPEKTVYKALRNYYDNDVTACFLAPLHPNQSRNNVWVCRPTLKILNRREK